MSQAAPAAGHAACPSPADSERVAVTIVEIASYLCVAAYLGLTVLLLVHWRRNLPSLLLIGACTGSALWAGAVASAVGDADWQSAIAPLEVLRDVAWFAFLLAVLAIQRQGDARARATLLGLGLTIGALVAGMAYLLTLDSAPAMEMAPLPPGYAPSGTNLRYVVALLLAIAGLVLVENLFRNTDPDQRWAIKFLAVGLGGVFAFDVFLYANAILVGRWDATMEAARIFANALVVPLIAVSTARNPDWAPRMHVSRRLVFHTATLLLSGLFLLVAAAAGYYVRTIGGDWGSVVETMLWFAAALAMAVVLLSGRFRAAVMLFLGRHFYSYKYDYREEWLRFIGKLADDESGASLGERVVRAVADVFEVPQGLLWLRSEGGFAVQEAWNMPPVTVVEPDDSCLVEWLERRQQPVDVSGRDAPLPQDCPLPDWLEQINRPWLIVPLVHRERLIGMILLCRSRVPRRLTEEDAQLLSILSRQAASYMAEWVAFEQLTQARRFEEFNQRVTFVVHDLKNLSSQLSLIVQNARKFRDNPEFVDDMIETVEDSVAGLGRLLAQLNAERARDADEPQRVRVKRALDEVMRRFSHAETKPVLAGCDDTMTVEVAPKRLSAVLRNLVRNALDAAGPTGRVTARGLRRDGYAVIEVEDDGPGMDPTFVRNELFRPFRSTKGTGYGVGAFEAREFARKAGGRLEVDSEVGRGTRMRLVLPEAAPAAGEQKELKTAI
jgi:putative PEP-CTERM system histidine kinase